jgi:regulator of protease activity HflC (stomatin/prohibitin superfamily)
VRRSSFESKPRIQGAGAVAIVLIIIIGGALVLSVGRIGVGYVAVIVDPVFGSTTSIGDGENAHYFFKAPWASVFKIYVATDSVNMWTERESNEDFPAVPSLTKDGLKVDVDITVRWRVSPSNIINLFRRFPSLDWKDRAIIPIIRETIRNLIVNFTAIETIERRGVISSGMDDALTQAFAEESSLAGAIIMDAVDVRRITLPENFVNAIESKLAAEQLSIAAEFNKTRILIIANATAHSQIIEAEGAAKSRVIIANATREAIASIAAVNPEVDESELTRLYIYLETLREIAQTGGGSFIIVTGETGEFIVPLPSQP